MAAALYYAFLPSVALTYCMIALQFGSATHTKPQQRCMSRMRVNARVWRQLAVCSIALRTARHERKPHRHNYARFRGAAVANALITHKFVLAWFVTPRAVSQQASSWFMLYSSLGLGSFTSLCLHFAAPLSHSTVASALASHLFLPCCLVHTSSFAHVSPVYLPPLFWFRLACLAFLLTQFYHLPFQFSACHYAYHTMALFIAALLHLPTAVTLPPVY